MFLVDLKPAKPIMRRIWAISGSDSSSGALEAVGRGAVIEALEVGGSRAIRSVAGGVALEGPVRGCCDAGVLDVELAEVEDLGFRGGERVRVLAVLRIGEREVFRGGERVRVLAVLRIGERERVRWRVERGGGLASSRANINRGH